MAHISNFSLSTGPQFRNIVTEESSHPRNTPGSHPARLESKANKKANEAMQHRPVSAPPLKAKKGIKELQPQASQNGSGAKTSKVTASKGPLKKASPKTVAQIDTALIETAGDLQRGDTRSWEILCESEINIGTFCAQNALTALQTLVHMYFSPARNKSFCEKNKLLIQQLCSMLTPEDLATLLASFAKSHYDNEPLIGLIELEIMGKMGEMNGKKREELSDAEKFTSIDIAKILHAHAKFGFIHPMLFAEIRNFAIQNIPYWPTRDLCQIAWAVAVLSNIQGKSKNTEIAQEDIALFQRLSSRLEERAFNGKLERDSDLSQALTFINYLEIFIGEEISKACPNLCEALKDFSEARSQNQPTSSKLHEDIQNVLQKMMSINLEKEQFIKGYFADIILEDHRIVEANGPTHYLLSGRSCGDQALRTRILGREGFHVTEIAYADWDKCETRYKKGPQRGEFNANGTSRKQKELLTKRVFANAPMEAPAESLASPSQTMNGSKVNGQPTPLLQPKQ